MSNVIVFENLINVFFINLYNLNNDLRTCFVFDIYIIFQFFINAIYIVFLLFLWALKIYKNDQSILVNRAHNCFFFWNRFIIVTRFIIITHQFLPRWMKLGNFYKSSRVSPRFCVLVLFFLKKLSFIIIFGSEFIKLLAPC